MCIACLEPAAIRRPESAEPPTAESSREEVLAFLHERNAAREVPRPVCRKCRYPFAPSDAGIVRHRLCSTCEARWLDNLVIRLIRRHGRKGAVRILKRLK